MTRGARWERGCRALATVTAIAAFGTVAACEGMLHEPARGGPVSIEISPSFTATTSGQQGMGAVFSQVNRVFVRVTSQASGQELVARDFAVGGSATEVRVRVNVDVGADEERFAVFVEMRRDADALFRGDATVTLGPAGGPPVEVPLAPVPAGIQMPPSPEPLTWIGETVQLGGNAVFATGDVIPGAGLEWTSLSPAIVEVSRAGLVTARGEGEGLVEGASGGFSETLPIVVAPIVVRVEVEPAAATVGIGGTLQLTAFARDEGGTALDRNAIWSSSNPQVASVDESGRVTGESTGTATVRAQVGDVQGEATVTVQQPPPTVETLVYGDVCSTTAELRGRVNPRGQPTQAWFEWGQAADLSDAQSTSVSSLPGTESFIFVQQELDDLVPATPYFYRAVASNASGTAVGQISEVGTLQWMPAVLDFSANWDGSVFINWGYPERDNYPEVTFQLERRAAASTTWIDISDLVEEISGSFFAEDEVTGSGSFEYRVRARTTTLCSDAEFAVAFVPAPS